MRFLSFLFLLVSSVGFTQDDLHTTICYGARRDMVKAERISSTPEKLNPMAQDTLHSKRQEELIVSLPWSNLIYVDYSNLIHISVGKKRMKNVVLECNGCDTIYRLPTGDPSEWVIRANTPGKITLKAINKKGKLISSTEIPVLESPTPNVYLDGFDAQSTLKTVPQQMRVKLDESVPLPKNLPVNRWTIVINDDEQFGGYGSAIRPEIREHMQSVGSGTIRIDISYFSPTGEKKTREIFSFKLDK